jgi:hypothetical protein
MAINLSNLFRNVGPTSNIFTRAGSVVGAVGGVTGNQALRDIGGQLTKGTRNFNIINPPSVGAAELKGSSYDPYRGTQSTQGYANKVIPSNNINNNSGSVLGASAGNNYNQGIQNIQDQGNQGLDFIDQDYQSALGMLSGQEEGLRSQAGSASGQIEGNAAAARGEITNQQGIAEQGIQGQQTTAESGAASAMQQARDLFRQTQQQNIAQLSALGISSSSVAEALAERLGVETARRIAGVTGSLQEVRQNAATELKRTKDYYSAKITDLQNWVGDQKANIQNALLTGLNQINSARNQAASDKARGRAELLSNVQNAVFSLTQQQQQFQQSLDAWKAQKDSSLAPIITDPNFINQLTQATNTFNQNFAPAGFGYAPQVSTDPYGNVKGNINYTLKQKEEELVNPFATQ